MLNFLLEIVIYYFLSRPGGNSRPTLIFVVLITATVLTLAGATIVRSTSF